MPVPNIQPHPTKLDAIMIGDSTHYIDDALITAKRIYDTCLVQIERERAMRNAAEKTAELITERTGKKPLKATKAPAQPATKPEEF